MFIAFMMKPMGDIDYIRAFDTESEADEFALAYSSYSELDPIMDDPRHWENYDPPIVILFEAEAWSAAENGKYKRPVAIYERGEKLRCERPKTEPRL
ncbi:MAG: hypothetical protein IT319_04300 [Anaerolineae bacterium]|nr:hypothetical protein [Anaerolineae bacterium]